MKSKISRIVLICFFLLTIPEVILWIADYDPKEFQIKVSGEVLGEFDENLFWRLKSVTPPFTKESKNSLKVICLTDSVSVMYEGKGYPETLQKLLSLKISEKTPVVFNGGVPGYTSFQGLKYFKRELVSLDPDYLVFCFGWNDHWHSLNGIEDKNQQVQKYSILWKWRVLSYLRGIIFKKNQKKYVSFGLDKAYRVSLEDYEKNLGEIVDISKREGIKLILMTSPYLEGNEEWITTHREYNNVVRKISFRESIPLVDLVNHFKNRKDLFIDPQADKVHYNWEGGNFVAEKLAKLVGVN